MSDERVRDEIARYFRQVKELYGNLLPLDPPSVPFRPDGLAHLGQDSESFQREVIVREDSVATRPAWMNASTLPTLEAAISSCQRCSLGASRKKFVFGTGSPTAEVVLIGEAPGAEEDAKGEPFVGRAGQLLNQILAAIQFAREDVYICNILKCRPPNNRDPLPGEVELCEPYLHAQLEILRPRAILALGRIAAQTLLRTSDSLTVLRAKVHSYHGIPLMVTYHPAALLRNPNWKRPTWEDVQKFRALYDELRTHPRS